MHIKLKFQTRLIRWMIHRVQLMIHRVQLLKIRECACRVSVIETSYT